MSDAHRHPGGLFVAAKALRRLTGYSGCGWATYDGYLPNLYQAEVFLPWMTERRHALFASGFEGTAAVTASTPPIKLCSGNLIRIPTQAQFGGLGCRKFFQLSGCRGRSRISSRRAWPKPSITPLAETDIAAGYIVKVAARRVRNPRPSSRNARPAYHLRPPPCAQRLPPPL
jgi:hypothetical protein